mgnify:CR=1 FL=1
MSSRERTYQVVGKSAVTVDFPDGNSINYPAGSVFKAEPSNSSVIRLVRINSVREMSTREIPNFSA